MSFNLHNKTKKSKVWRQIKEIIGNNPSKCKLNLLGTPNYFTHAMEAEMVGFPFAYVIWAEALLTFPPPPGPPPPPGKKKNQEETKAILEILRPLVVENEAFWKNRQKCQNYVPSVSKTTGSSSTGHSTITMACAHLLEISQRESIPWMGSLSKYLITNCLPSRTESQKRENQGNMRDVDEGWGHRLCFQRMPDITLRLKARLEFRPLKENSVWKMHLMKWINPLINVLADMEFEGIQSIREV